MLRPPLSRFAGFLVVTLVTVGFISVAAADTTPPAPEIEVPAGDDLPSIRPVRQPTTTTTSTIPPTTTAPPTTTTTTTTAPPTTVPPTTVPPATVPPTTAPVTAPPPPAPVPEPAPVPAPAPVTPPSMNACESDLMRFMNEARSANGIAPLAADGAIAHVPKSWAQQLLGLANLAHNPAYAGQVFAARPEATTVAENVGRSAGSVRGVFDSFMQSSGHRSAILRPAHTHAAVGCTTDVLGQHWVAVNFWG